MARRAREVRRFRDELLDELLAGVGLVEQRRRAPGASARPGPVCNQEGHKVIISPDIRIQLCRSQVFLCTNRRLVEKRRSRHRCR